MKRLTVHMFAAVAALLITTTTLAEVVNVPTQAAAVVSQPALA